MDKLTEHELLNRLDNEFYDVDFQVVTSATRGKRVINGMEL